MTTKQNANSVQSVEMGNRQCPPSTVSSAAIDIIQSLSAEPLSPQNKDEWQATWEAYEQEFLESVKLTRQHIPATIETKTIAGTEHLLVTPKNISRKNENRIAVYFHGGAFTLGSPESSLSVSLIAAHNLNARVLTVRYPMAWERPHPAQRDASVAVYKELLQSYVAKNIVFFGDSAGGSLAASTVLELRSEQIELPAAVGLFSPWADLTKTGDSLNLLSGADILIDYDINLTAAAELFSQNQDMKNPSISPVYADYHQGFPPTFISSGTRDLFLSHCVRLQRKLIDNNIDNQLIIYEGMWHVFQAFDIPEADIAWQDFTKFIEKHWADIKN